MKSPIQELLTFGFCFNNSINKLPSGLKSITVQKFYQQIIILPSGLNIKFEKDYNDKYEIGKKITK
jgi:hypothetical protein